MFYVIRRNNRGTLKRKFQTRQEARNYLRNRLGGSDSYAHLGYSIVMRRG